MMNMGFPSYHPFQLSSFPMPVELKRDLLVSYSRLLGDDLRNDRLSDVY